jgi:hypothetical protein
LLIPYECSDEDDSDTSFPDDPRFVDSGWGGECLQDIEEIDFEFVYALHTFVATVEGQANATKGDTMVLLDDSNSYWWLVRVVKDSSIGYLPAEHIETPTERLARLNKHRNVDLSATMLGDQTIKPKNPFIPGIRRKRKTVAFSEPTYVDYPEVDYSTEEEDIDELFGKQPAGAQQQAEPQKTEEEQKQQAQQQTQSQDAKVDAEQKKPDATSEEVKNDAKVKPLSTRSRKEVDNPEPVLEETAEELERDKASEAEDVSVDSRLEVPSKSRNGNIRNTDSFFKDESLETKKITLTPNLLRDEGVQQPSDPTNRDVKSRTSLDKMEKEFMSDKDRKKSKEKEKKEKEKKPSAIRNFFSRKDKKKSSEEDDESFGKRSMDTPSEPRESEDPVAESPDRNSLQKSGSRLQKQQPRTESSLVTKAPALSGPKPSSVEYGRTNDVSNVPPASMRIVDPETKETKEVSSNQVSREASRERTVPVSRETSRDRSAPIAMETSRDRSASIARESSRDRAAVIARESSRERSASAGRDSSRDRAAGVGHDSSKDRAAAIVRERSTSSPKLVAKSAGTGMDTRLQQPMQARTRMDLDMSSDEDDDFAPEKRTNQQAANEPPHTSPAQRPAPAPTHSDRSLRPQLPGAFPDSYQTVSSVSSDKTVTPLNVETDASGRLSESPVEVSPISPVSTKPPGLVVDMPSREGISPESSPSPELVYADEASKVETSTTTTTTSREENWDDSKLRAFFDEGDHVRDLLVVVYDKTNVASAGKDHPIAGTLFREQNAKLAEITTQLDNMLGDWLARKQRLRGTV